MLVGISAQESPLISSVKGLDASGNEVGMSRRGNTNSTLRKNTSKGAYLNKDSLIVTKPLQILSQSGLDLLDAQFNTQAGLFRFNFCLEDEKISRFSANGYYNAASRHLSVDMSFRAVLVSQDADTGDERAELFEFDFHLEVTQLDLSSGSARIDKESILEFARKLVTEIARLHGEGKEIDGLILDAEDLRELGEVEEGRLLESIMALIELMRAVERLRSKKNSEHVWISLEREKALVIEESRQESKEVSFSLSVKKVSTEAVQDT